MPLTIRPRHKSRASGIVASVCVGLMATLSLVPAAAARADSVTGTWTVKPSPNPAGALHSGLSAVSCPLSDTCIAVGSATFSSGRLPNPDVLIEQLSHGSWTVVSTPTVTSAVASSLSGVSCPVVAFCAAVGSVQVTAHGSPDLLADTWNGTSWSDTLLPVPLGGSDPDLSTVSCAAQRDCVAVGNYFDNNSDSYRPLAERLDGSKWSVIPAPVPPHGGGSYGDSEFTAVACPRPGQCEVVGDVAYNDTLQNVFAYGLSGSRWTYQHQVNPGPDPGNADSAVSCIQADACTSVGTVAIVGELSLAEYWDGSTWVRQVTPASNRRPDQALSDVSCGGGSSCVAVGEAYRVNQRNGHLVGGQPVGEVSSGGTWTLSRPVVPSGANAALAGISCTSATACVAVGSTSTSSTEATLVEAYSG
jgi:hypothetical protein